MKRQQDINNLLRMIHNNEEVLPKFGANRPEESISLFQNRINRLQIVFEYLMRKHRNHIENQIDEMYDHKGSLFVHWKKSNFCKYREKKLQVYVEEAWTLVGFEQDFQVKHSYNDIHGKVSGEKLLDLHKNW